MAILTTSTSRSTTRHFLSRLGIVVLALFSSVAKAQNLAPSLVMNIERYINNRTAGQEFSGTVLVSQHGKVVLNKSFGMADYENSAPNTPQTKFRIGSLTKPFTAITILALEERGKLSVLDSITKYIEACPKEWRGVRIRDLLTHTSGVPDLFGAMEAVPVEQTADEIDRVLTDAKNTKLVSAPGEVYRYNNFGYCLLGYILEKASGKLYAEVLHDYILGPLKMEQTLYDDPRPIIKNRASGYVRKDGLLVNDKPTDPAGYSAGGLLSSTSDLLVLNQALRTNTVLSQNSRDRMFSPFKNEYGFGWKITTTHNRPAYNHTGATNGFSSHMVAYPNDDVIIIVLSNVENETIRGIAEEIAGIGFGGGTTK